MERFVIIVSVAAALDPPLCPFDILHNPSCKAGTSFSQVSGFDIEDHAMDLYDWFDKPSKRKSGLKEYYNFCNTE